MEPYDFILKNSREAGALLMRLREEAYETRIKENDPRNIVTSVDERVSEFLVSAIRGAFPSHAVYSEEGGGASQESEYIWTIDPIDGTSNFSRRIPHFSVCIGLLHKGRPVVGAVYNPTTEELYSFKKDGGAFLNGKPMQVSSIAELSKSHVFLHAGRNPKLWDWGGESYKKLLRAANKTSNHAGSALDICFIAAGRIEGVVYGGLATMDVAGALGILEEAGGVAISDGEKIPPFSLEGKKFIAANNLAILTSLQKLI